MLPITGGDGHYIDARMHGTLDEQGCKCAASCGKVRVLTVYTATEPTKQWLRRLAPTY